MNRIRKWFAVVSLVGMLVVAGGLARGVAAAQEKSAKDVALAWLDALNAHDEARLRELSSPKMVLESEPGTPDHVVVSYDDFFGSLHEDVESELHWTVLSAEETAPDTVFIEASLTSHDIPVLEHGFVVNVTFTVENGQVLHTVDTLSEQTKAELAALTGVVGMPTTGASDMSLVAVMLAAGALALGAGVVARRRAS